VHLDSDLLKFHTPEVKATSDAGYGQISGTLGKYEWYRSVSRVKIGIFKAREWAPMKKSARGAVFVPPLSR
jgi:hypothetical protein